MDLEELLPEGDFDEIYFINSSNIEGSGYSLNFETRSFGRMDSENIVEKVEVYPLPINWLKEIRLIPEGELITSNNLKLLKVNKKGVYNYEIEIEGKGLLVLTQAYQDGWNASIKGQELEHVKANGWANGWVISESDDEGINKVSIVYWPQYLQFVGFGLLVICIIIVITKGLLGKKV